MEGDDDDEHEEIWAIEMLDFMACWHIHEVEAKDEVRRSLL
jgi:hypothetical protein